MATNSDRDSHVLIRAAIFAVFLVLVAAISWKFGPGIIRLMRKPEQFRAFVEAHGRLRVLLYILIQAAHIVIVFIPGEIVQIAAGYAFGTGWGTLYSLLGMILGTVVVFFATRYAGYSLVKVFVPPKKLEQFDTLMAKPGFEIALFVLFLIPGVPKDTLVYMSGVTPIRPLRFFLISLTARFPGLWGAAYIGANLQRRHYLPVWLMSGAAVILFVVGVLARDRIIRTIERHRHRLSGTPPISKGKG